MDVFENGQPNEEWLRKIKKALQSKDLYVAMRAFYEALKQNYYGACGIEEVDVRGERTKVFAYHTFGWSGNEEIIRTLKESILFDMLLERYDSGGHYYFTITPLQNIPRNQ